MLKEKQERELQAKLEKQVPPQTQMQNFIYMYMYICIYIIHINKYFVISSDLPEMNNGSIIFYTFVLEGRSRNQSP